MQKVFYVCFTFMILWGHLERTGEKKCWKARCVLLNTYFNYIMVSPRTGLEWKDRREFKRMILNFLPSPYLWLFLCVTGMFKSEKSEFCKIKERNNLSLLSKLIREEGPKIVFISLWSMILFHFRKALKK